MLGENPARLSLPYVQSFKDRYGKLRYDFRLKGQRAPLGGVPGSNEFIQAYTAALEAPRVTPAVKPARGGIGTFDALAAMYFASTEYFSLSPKTRHVYKLVIERLYRDEKLGHRLVKQMQREHVQKIVTKRAQTPVAAN